MSWQQILLRLEGAAVLGMSVWMFARLDGGWVLFAVLILAPDLSALGFLGGKRLGAAVYNAAHTYVGPVILATVGVAGGWPVVTQMGLIWFAHIGVDRAIGYGLKYATERKKDTHVTRA